MFKLIIIILRWGIIECDVNLSLIMSTVIILEDDTYYIVYYPMLCINRSDIYICLHIHSKLFMKKSTAPEVTKFDRCAVTMSDFCFILMGFCRVGSRAYSVPDINTCTAKGGKPKWGTKFFYTVLELWCKAIIWTNHISVVFLNLNSVGLSSW